MNDFGRANVCRNRDVFTRRSNDAGNVGRNIFPRDTDRVCGLVTDSNRSHGCDPRSVCRSGERSLIRPFVAGRDSDEDACCMSVQQRRRHYSIPGILCAAADGKVDCVDAIGNRLINGRHDGRVGTIVDRGADVVSNDVGVRRDS